MIVINNIFLFFHNKVLVNFNLIFLFEKAHKEEIFIKYKQILMIFLNFPQNINKKRKYINFTYIYIYILT